MEYIKLNGSEKQIAWAEDIRRKTVEYQTRKHGAIEEMKPNRKAGMLILTQKISSAAWWIDHRFGFEMVLRDAIAEFGNK